MCTDINADICQTLTAKGQQNWTGSFISPDIASISKSSLIGGGSPTHITLINGQEIDYIGDDNLPDIRIRKLTPKECCRLQGFDDESIDKMLEVNSNSQVYKQAGNGICVPVLEYIFRNLIEEK